MTDKKVVEWGNVGGYYQKGRDEFYPVYDLGFIKQSSGNSYDSGIELKVHATKTYKHGMLLGYGLSSDKKTRIWQHIDGTATSKSQKEAYGILILTYDTEPFTYKTNTECKTFRHFKVLCRDAIVDANWLNTDTSTDLDKHIRQLELNCNITVKYENTILSDILEKAGDVA